MAERERKDKEGYLWHEVDAEVVKSGQFTMNGERVYCSILRSQDRHGRENYEFVQSLGLIFMNENKLSENSPDMGGKVTIDGNRFTIGAWFEEGAKGPYTSIKFKEVESEQHSNRPPQF